MKHFACCHECRWAKEAPSLAHAWDLRDLHAAFTGHLEATVVTK